MRILSILLFAPIVLVSKECISQEIEATRIKEAVVIDGKLAETVWGKAEEVTNFIQFEPVYGAASTCMTSVRVLYDEQMVYFGFECSDPEVRKISAKVTRRDGNVEEDDAVVVMLDTFNDKNNAYYFVINSIGTQLDGKVADNGKTDDNTWDTAWKSAAHIIENGWSAEIAIPFSSLKFDEKNSTWGFNAGRIIPRNLERSFWIDGLIDVFRVSQFGTIANLNLKGVSTKRITVIPYGQSQIQKRGKNGGKVGVDVQYNLSNNMVLDATVNPDFATIEADVERVNLTRFELFFPEKRPFFLEGAENYSTRIRQFYSRRIGEIPWGIKLDGKVNKWKFNVLSTQSDPATAGAEVETGSSANYMVFRVNREIKEGSNIGILGANRSFLNKNSGSVGLVGTLFFTELYGMTSQIIRSYGTANDGTWAFFFRPAYDSQNAHFHIRYTHLDAGIRENINPVGFIRDDDRKEFDTNIRKEFWINKNGIESIAPMINYNRYWSQKGVLRSWDDINELEIKFLKKWELELTYREEFKRFEKDFRNSLVEGELIYDSKMGYSVWAGYGKGKNYDSELEEITGGFNTKIIDGLNITYRFTKSWLKPDYDDENSWIHYIRTTYYVNKDLYFKLFYQTKYNFSRGFLHPRFELDRETVQFVFVWRFLPPFGSIQLAYQEGTSKFSDTQNQGKTVFSKIAWVF